MKMGLQFFKHATIWKKWRKDVIEDEKGNTFNFSYIENSIYNDTSKLMVSWRAIDSFFKKKIQISDIGIMNAAFGSSGFFGSIVRSTFIGRNTYTGRRRKFRSKSTHIYGPVHKS